MIRSMALDVGALLALAAFTFVLLLVVGAI